jgi:4-aminobutyrate aminotransferase
VISQTKAQIDRMQHVSTCFPNEPMVNLAEKLAQITPGALKKSYFTNSGTEANETAIRWRGCTPGILRLWLCGMAIAGARR